MTNEELVEVIKGTSGAEKNDLLMQLYRQCERFIQKKANRFRWGLISENDTDDLMQEGYIILEKAVEDYDREKGYEFISFLNWYLSRGFGMYASICRGLSGMSENCRLLLRKMETESESYFQKYGVYPSDFTLSMLLNVSEETVKKMQDLKEARTVSLDAPIGDDDLTIADTIPDGRSIEDEVIEAEDRRQRKRIVRKYISELGEAQKTCIILRFFRGLPVKKVAWMMDKPVSKINSLYQSAIERLRRSIGHDREGRYIKEEYMSSAYGSGYSTERTALRILEDQGGSRGNRTKH